MIVLSFVRSLLAAAIFPVFTLVISLLGIVEAFLIHNFNYESGIIKLWGVGTLKIFNVKVQCRGLENIPKGSCLFIFNHTSFFDIFVMNAVYPHFRFGAKIELFKIPIMGTAMRRLGVLPIARQRKGEVFRIYEEARARAVKGEKFALSPEGGRTRAEKLFPFKAGPFLFAINSGMPLVPVVIRGALEVQGKGQIIPNWDRWSRTIKIDYLPALSVEGYTVETRAQLQEQAFAVMKPYFEKARDLEVS